MEGTVHVEFRIARDGSVEGVKVAKSSGYPLLDEASVQAIKRAAPLPIVPGKIRVPISYLLHNTAVQILALIVNASQVSAHPVPPCSPRA
jgi:TonB family protein